MAVWDFCLSPHVYQGYEERQVMVDNRRRHRGLLHKESLWVDTIKSSRHVTMEELRPRGRFLRILFAFDPRRAALLMIGCREFL
ncbi:MAG: hypothetical protein NVS2B7_34630 [Herpetosiphon sp.]